VSSSNGAVGAFVQMPIPADLVGEVYELVSRRMRGENGVTAVPGPEGPGQGDGPDAVAGDEASEVWSVEDFRRLLVLGSPAAEVMVAILDEMYNRGGDPVSTTDVVGELGMEKVALRGALSAFSRRTLPQVGRKHWPIEFHRSQPGQDSYYVTDRDTLARWTEARQFARDAAAELRPGKDWSRIDRVLDRLPYGSWTTYGDLAAFDGTSPRAVGQRMVNPKASRNAFRVLDRSGRVRDGFTWNDPAAHDRDVVEELAKAGVVLDENGAASAGTRLRPRDLTALLDQD